MTESFYETKIFGSFNIQNPAKTHSEPCQISKMEHFVIIVNDYRLLTIFCKMLYFRCLAGVWIRPCITIIDYFDYLCHLQNMETEGSKCVTWHYFNQTQHFPTSIVDFQQGNAGSVILNQTWYNTTILPSL